jgi:hypothetical protein
MPRPHRSAIATFCTLKGSNEEVAAFILGLLVDGPRSSEDIHRLAEKYFGKKHLLGPRQHLGNTIETGVGAAQGQGRAKYWRLKKRRS